MRITFALFLALATFACAQDTKTTDATAKDSASTTGEKTKLTQEELEAKFIATMNKATMTGRWCLIKDGKLTPEKEEKYTIIGVKKLEGDSWMIGSKMNYGGKEIVAPIPVKVKWAGDTAVIIVDKLTIPNGGTYSARVLVYEKTYAGSWSGGEHVGLLNGVITNEKE